jgi:hypothetical protein
VYCTQGYFVCVLYTVYTESTQDDVSVLMYTQLCVLYTCPVPVHRMYTQACECSHTTPGVHTMSKHLYTYMCLYTEFTHRYLSVYSYFTWYTDCTHICSHRGACTQGCAHTSQVVQGICTHLYTQRSLNTQDAVSVSYYDPTQNILWTQVHTFVHAKVPKHTEDVIKSHDGPNLHKTCSQAVHWHILWIHPEGNLGPRCGPGGLLLVVCTRAQCPNQ